MISSLGDLSLYRLSFDKDYNKINFYERIFVGQRIRDIKYHKGINGILLALESHGQLGILKVKK